MNNLFPNTGGILNTGNRETKAFLKAVRNDLQHLHLLAAGRKLQMASQRVVSKVPPSLKTYLNGLSQNLAQGKVTSSMSVPAFDAAVAQAAAQVANNRAREANRIQREQKELANKARRNAEAAARQQNAQRRAAANRVKRQAEANARAAERIAEKRAREAAEAKRAANEAREAKRRENEARAAAAEKARYNASRAKTGPSPSVNRTLRNKQNREFQEQIERVSHWQQVFKNTKAQHILTTRQTVRRMARNHLGLNLNSVLLNTGNVSKKVRFLLHPNKGKTVNNKALRQVLTVELAEI